MLDDLRYELDFTIGIFSRRAAGASDLRRKWCQRADLSITGLPCAINMGDEADQGNVLGDCGCCG